MLDWKGDRRTSPCERQVRSSCRSKWQVTRDSHAPGSLEIYDLVHRIRPQGEWSSGHRGLARGIQSILNHSCRGLSVSKSAPFKGLQRFTRRPSERSGMHKLHSHWHTCPVKKLEDPRGVTVAPNQKMRKGCARQRLSLKVFVTFVVTRDSSIT
jgi:hypothetical protein